MVQLGVLRANSGCSIDFLLASPQIEIFLCAFLPHQYKRGGRQRTLQQRNYNQGNFSLNWAQRLKEQPNPNTASLSWPAPIFAF